MGRRLPKEDRAGLYITVIVHLTVIIVLLSVQLGASIGREESFVLDFTKQEQIEKLQAELSRKEALSRKLEAMLNESSGETDIHNVTVNKEALKDDRGTDAEKLYKDAERLQQDLNAPHPESGPEEMEQPEPDSSQKPQKEAVRPYTGPSVLSWQLDGRQARKLPIPAYRCMGAGEVTVIITVNPKGDVIDASISEGVSSSDQCLRNFAVRAARMSRFSASVDAPARQPGNIVYSFIAQ